jgi:glycosyltransferase involved in cell wall biosynthesis
MGEKNKVSVIVTVRNEDKNIVILLDSLLRQTLKWEDIVINDNGSTDNTVSVIKEYQEKYKNIKLIASDGKSIGEGRNTAIANSTGDIIAVMDAGICPEHTWLERVVAPLLYDPSIDVSWGHVIFDTKSRIIPSTALAKSIVFLTKYPENRKNGKNVTCSAFRRSVWTKLGRFPEIQIPIEDLLLIDAISKNQFKETHVFDAKAYYFNYPKNIAETFKKWIVSACCSFLVQKSEKGFVRQFLIFGLFFLTIFLVCIDLKMIVFVFLYVIFFLVNKMISNIDLGKEIFSNLKLLITTLNLFFILNFARLIGVIKAIFLIIFKKQPQILYNYRNQETR